MLYVTVTCNSCFSSKNIFECSQIIFNSFIFLERVLKVSVTSYSIPHNVLFNIYSL